MTPHPVVDFNDREPLPCPLAPNSFGVAGKRPGHRWLPVQCGFPDAFRQSVRIPLREFFTAAPGGSGSGAASPQLEARRIMVRLFPRQLLWLSCILGVATLLPLSGVVQAQPRNGFRITAT